MNGSAPKPENVVRVELKRADAWELASREPLVMGSALVKALGGRARDCFGKATVRRAADKAVIFQKGDAGSSLFVVLAGEVRLLGRKGTDTVELGSAKRGEVFGEGEALSGAATRGCSAVAHGPADVIEFPREVLLLPSGLPQPIKQVLDAVARSRNEKLDELTDFLNRW